MKTRIYITGYKDQIRIVRAKNRQQALEHVASGIISVSAINKQQLEEQMIKGTKIEDATGGETASLEN